MDNIVSKTIKIFLLFFCVSFLYAQTGDYGARYFDGDDYITFGNTNIDGQINITVEAWVWLQTASSEYHTVFSMTGGAGGGWDGVIFQFNQGSGTEDDDKINLWLGGINEGFSNLCTKRLTAQRWTHVAGTWDGDWLRYYIDGEACGAYNLGDGAITWDNVAGEIGRRNDGGSYLTGALKDVRVWKIARTEREILSSYEHSIYYKTPELVGNWQLKEIGLEATDTAGNNSSTQTFGTKPEGAPPVRVRRK